MRWNREPVAPTLCLWRVCCHYHVELASRLINTDWGFLAVYKTVAGAKLTKRCAEDRAIHVAKAVGISRATLKIADVLAVDPER